MCFYFLRFARLQAPVSLRVPKYGQILEFLNFTILLLTFLLCLSSKRPLRSGLAADPPAIDQRFDRINIYELIFQIFAISFALAEYASVREHGWESAYSSYSATLNIYLSINQYGLRMQVSQSHTICHVD
jgi:hypothetical protein